jgi:hypothetical protein
MRGLKVNVLTQHGGKMPIRRRGLTKTERAEDLARAEQLRASGVEIEILEKWREQNPALDIMVGTTAANTVYELRTGGIGYAPHVRLVARSGLTITDSYISTRYDDQIVLASFLDGPICRLGRTEYWQDEALNQQIENGLVLRRGDVVEGYVLATGLEQIPIKYGKFAVPFEIVFLDQFGNEFPANGMFSIAKQIQRDNVTVKKGTGLYGPDASAKQPGLSIQQEMTDRYRESLAQDKRSEQQRVPRDNDARVGGIGNAEQSADRQEKLMNQLVEFMRRPDLDDMLKESTSTGDEVVRDSQCQPVQQGKSRVAKGSGLYVPDSTGRPADLPFEEVARRRLVNLVAHEKNAEQRRVVGTVDEK